MGHKQAQTSLEQALRLRPHWQEAETALQQSEHAGFFKRFFRR
jgi:hypothetical protein